jgi:hypothetical protein
VAADPGAVGVAVAPLSRKSMIACAWSAPRPGTFSSAAKSAWFTSSRPQLSVASTTYRNRSASGESGSFRESIISQGWPGAV